ncbi:MAG: DUF5721 family protein [Eubacteriales bacterium]|nr:DUF5721 family protein [Eubacteriales bacterium]
MRAFNISDNGMFMRLLLTSSVFDGWDLIKAQVTMGCRFEIAGERQADFYEDEAEKTGYVGWAAVKPFVYEIIRGKKPPLQMLIVLRHPTCISSQTQDCMMNIQLQHGVIQVISGVSYKTFTLDKSDERTWDDTVEALLKEHKVPYEAFI